MRVLLVNPAARPRQRLGDYAAFSLAAPAPPTGLAYIASVLRQDGVDVGIIDQHARGWDNDRLARDVRAFRPDVVGFSCLTFAMEGVEDAVPKVREAAPGVHVVLGNTHPTYFDRELVAAGVADSVVRGEGERAMSDLCSALRAGRSLDGVLGVTFRDGDEVRRNPDRPVVPDLDSLPFPAWDLLVEERYLAEPIGFRALSGTALSIQASRGCPYGCTFCAQDVIYPKLRKRDMRRVVAEMEWASTTFGVTTFGFIDAIFPFSHKQLDAFGDALRVRGLDGRFTWFTETRVDLVDRELLRKAHALGCRFILFGVESGDEAVLDSMNKSSAPEMARRALRWSREVGILSFGLFVIGMPGETRQQVERTIRFARETDADMVKFNIATPYPGSQIWERYKDRLAGQPTWKYSGWFDPTLNDSEHLLAGDTLPASELVELQRKAMLSFYLRPRVAWRYLAGDLIPRRRLIDGARTLVSAYARALWNRRGAPVPRGGIAVPAS